MNRQEFERLLDDYLGVLLWCDAMTIALRRERLIRYVFPAPEPDRDAEVQAGYAEDEAAYTAQVEDDANLLERVARGLTTAADAEALRARLEGSYD